MKDFSSQSRFRWKMSLNFIILVDSLKYIKCDSCARLGCTTAVAVNAHFIGVRHRQIRFFMSSADTVCNLASQNRWHFESLDIKSHINANGLILVMQ